MRKILLGQRYKCVRVYMNFGISQQARAQVIYLLETKSVFIVFNFAPGIYYRAVIKQLIKTERRKICAGRRWGERREEIRDTWDHCTRERERVTARPGLRCFLLKWVMAARCRGAAITYINTALAEYVCPDIFTLTHVGMKLFALHFFDAGQMHLPASAQWEHFIATKKYAARDAKV